MYLVSLDPAGPYPKFVKTRSDVGGWKSITIREEAAIGRCRHQVLLPNVSNLALISLCFIGVPFEISVFGTNQGSRGRETEMGDLC